MEDLDREWEEAVAADDERDRRRSSLTPEVIDLGARRISKWGDQWRKDILEMEDNERRMVVLFAALLDASPARNLE